MAAEPERPPAQPTYILRGHAAQIHAVHFFRDNTRLLTGDADGWVIAWHTITKRAVAVWKAHANTILGLGSWDDARIITHGRDNKLLIWHLPPAAGPEEQTFSTTLPIDDASSERKAPWLLHSLAVNAINFCAFAVYRRPRHHRSLSGNVVDVGIGVGDRVGDGVDDTTAATTTTTNNELLIATPGVQDGCINVTAFPTERRVATIPGPAGTQTGMLMAVGLSSSSSHTNNDNEGDDDDGAVGLTVLAGYESGHVCVWRRQRSPPRPHQQQGSTVTTTGWEAVYVAQAHAQPVLSLSVAAERGCFFTSAADAIVARHPLVPGSGVVEMRTVQTRHAGQQSIVVRSDEAIFATAGWDGRVRVYAAKSMDELAVLKYHKEGCYALAFAKVLDEKSDEDGVGDEKMLVKRDYTVSGLRMRKAKITHWIAAGSKDGKVSLWDIY